MFERILVHEQRYESPGQPLDLGSLVEAMLYYDSVHLIANANILKQLASAWTPAGVVELVEAGHLRVSYMDNFAAIFTERKLGRERHSVVVGEIHRGQGGRPLGAQDTVPRVFAEVGGKSGRARRLARRFLDKANVGQIDGALVDRVRADMADRDYVNSAIRDLMHTLAPEYSVRVDWDFAVHPSDEMFAVESNINWLRLNAEYRQHVPVEHSTLSPAYLLSHLIAARQMLEQAVADDAELATDSAHSAVIRRKMTRVIEARLTSSQHIERFQEFAVDNAYAVRETVNARSPEIREILRLLEKARRFKEWLSGVPPDADLIKEYHRASLAETWADKLPTKTVRWVLFTGLGAGAELMSAGLGGGAAIGAAAGAAVGAVDSLWLDRLVKGWTPNQFVDKALDRIRPANLIWRRHLNARRSRAGGDPCLSPRSARTVTSRSTASYWRHCPRAA